MHFSLLFIVSRTALLFSFYSFLLFLSTKNFEKKTYIRLKFHIYTITNEIIRKIKQFSSSSLNSNMLFSMNLCFLLLFHILFNILFVIFLGGMSKRNFICNASDKDQILFSKLCFKFPNRKLKS